MESTSASLMPAAVAGPVTEFETEAAVRIGVGYRLLAARGKGSESMADSVISVPSSSTTLPEMKARWRQRFMSGDVHAGCDMAR